MKYDRVPRPVVIDEITGQEEMEVDLSTLELIETAEKIDLKRKLTRAEPWVRYRATLDGHISTGVELYYEDEEDGA